MNSFAGILRHYPMSGGVYAGRVQPSAAKQADGFRPTYLDASGSRIDGDPVDVAELNYIFNDLYAQAAQVDKLLTEKGK